MRIIRTIGRWFIFVWFGFMIAWGVPWSIGYVAEVTHVPWYGLLFIWAIGIWMWGKWEDI